MFCEKISRLAEDVYAGDEGVVNLVDEINESDRKSPGWQAAIKQEAVRHSE